MTAEGLRTLSSLEKVEKLGLQGCSRVNDAAVAELAKWKALKYVDLQEDPVTEKGLAEFEGCEARAQDPQRRHSAASACSVQQVGRRGSGQSRSRRLRAADFLLRTGLGTFHL